MSRSRRRRRASTDQVAVVDRLEIEEVRPRRRGERSSTRRFRPLRWLFAAVTVAALLTAALPTVILRTDLKNRILPRAIPEFEGTIHIGDGTGGWISPLSLRDVVIRDETGKEVVRIDEVDSERNVWQLAQDAEDVGRLRLTRLWLAVEITESGSNLERLFAPFLEDDDDEDDDDDDDDSDTNVFIEIVDGKIDVSHPMAKQAWSVEGINLSADCPADIAQAVTGQLQAVVRRDEVESKVSGQFQWLRPTEFSVEKLGVGQFHFLSEGLPLELLQPLWERLGQRIDLAGMLVANLAGTWTDTDAGPAAEASGSVSLRSLSCAAPRILGDRVRLDHADAELAIKIADGMLDLGDVKVQSDLFGVQLTGKLPLQELSLEGILATLLDPKSLHYYKVRIALDLRKLAGTMPHVLRLRPGTDVESGQVQATVESIADLQGRHLKLDMTAEQLAASFEGQRFAWSQPLDLKLDALSHGPSWRQLQVNSLRCVAPFFEAEAQGDHRAGTLRLTGNLSQWQQELSRFVELPQQELQGTVLSQSAWEIQADGLTRATSRVTLQDFVYRAAESLPIEERLLTIDADLQARADDSGVHELAWGKFAVVAMDDQLRLEVTQPVGSPSLQAAYPVRGELHGDLTRWMARLQP
ncbi:MAG: hypothetical protein KDA99_17135, partial [Planctomycetales bacterium]|nr:hypothetical protein [Planctomycetales bacterium]